MHDAQVEELRALLTRAHEIIASYAEQLDRSMKQTQELLKMLEEK